MAIISDHENSSDEIRTTTLNPEAQNFIPASLSLPPHVYPQYFISTYLISLHPCDFSYAQLSYYQPEPEPEPEPQYFSTPEKNGVLAVAEPFKPKKAGLYRNKHHVKGYGKQGFVKADCTRAFRKKLEWKAKPCSFGTEKKKISSRNIADHRQAQAPFEYPRKRVQDSARKTNRENKHALLPLKPDGKETTVMIKNIPIRYNREMLKEFLDLHCMLSNGEAKSENGDTAFDFLYLPIDFDTRSNKGYAFVNFTNPVAARKFFDACHDQHWEYFKSSKIRQICCAKLQGIEELIEQFKTMTFPSEEFQPLSFKPARDGSKQSVEETLIGRYDPTAYRRNHHSKSK